MTYTEALKEFLALVEKSAKAASTLDYTLVESKSWIPALRAGLESFESHTTEPLRQIVGQTIAVLELDEMEGVTTSMYRARSTRLRRSLTQ